MRQNEGVLQRVRFPSPAPAFFLHPAVALTLSATLHTPIPRSRLHPGRAIVVCVLFKGGRLAAQQGFHAACHRFAVALGKVAQNQQQKISVILRQAGLQQALFQLLRCNLLIDDVPACNPREDGGHLVVIKGLTTAYSGPS